MSSCFLSAPALLPSWNRRRGSAFLVKSLEVLFPRGHDLAVLRRSWEKGFCRSRLCSWEPGLWSCCCLPACFLLAFLVQACRLVLGKQRCLEFAPLLWGRSVTFWRRVLGPYACKFLDARVALSLLISRKKQQLLLSTSTILLGLRRKRSYLILLRPRVGDLILI